MKPSNGQYVTKSKHLNIITMLLEQKDEKGLSYQDISDLIGKEYRENYSVAQLKHFKLSIMPNGHRIEKARKEVVSRMSDPNQIINVLEQRRAALIAQRQRMEILIERERKLYHPDGKTDFKTGVEIERFARLLNYYREDLQAIGLLEMQSQTFINNQVNVVNQQNQAIFNISSLPLAAQKRISEIVMKSKQEADKHDNEEEYEEDIQRVD